MKSLFLPFVVLTVVLSGCDLFLGDEPASSQVAVNFEVAPYVGAAAKTGALPAGLLADELVLEGPNGTLKLTDVRMIVEKFKLEREDDACDDDGEDHPGEDDDSCEKFSAPPSFVSLPLTGGTVTVSTGELPAGTFTEMEFKVDDLDLDGADDDHPDDDSGEEVQQARELLNVIREEFPNWPEDASMLFVGSFTPTGGTERTFAVYAEAEIEVEMDLNPPLVLGTDDSDNLTVEIDPVAWVTLADGRLLDLSALDLSGDGLLEFEIKIKEGFTEIRVEDDDDHGSDDDDDEGDDD